MDLRYFDLSEFASPDVPGSGTQMNEEFLIKIDKARHIAGIPFIINSGFRSNKHNREVGGVDGSAHTKGLASDIKAENSRNRYKILTACHEVGFNRIGVADTYIHVDMDHSKSGNVIWTY